MVHDQTSQPSPTFPTCLQPSRRAFCPTCGHQFIFRRLTCHQYSCHTSNPSNQNLHDYLSPIPSLIPNMLTLAWVWVSALYVLRSFHFGFCHSRLYNHIPTALRHDVQVAFCFPLDKLTQDPYDAIP